MSNPFFERPILNSPYAYRMEGEFGGKLEEAFSAMVDSAAGRRGSPR